MLQRVFNRSLPMTDHDQREPPRLPPQEAPGERQSYTPPRLRRDPEVEAMVMSANTLIELRARVQDLEAEVATLTTELATWRARAEAKQELLDGMLIDLNRYKSFCDTFTARFTDVSVLLVKLMDDADRAAQDFASSDSIRAGSRTESVIDESHLTGQVPNQENQDDK